MKKYALLFICIIGLQCLNAQRGVRIGYVDMNYILENVEEYTEASTQLNNKVQKWKIEIEQKQSVVQQMRKDLNSQKVLLTKELIEEKEEEISILEAEMLEYQQNRFGPNGDLFNQKRLLIQPIQDQVFNAVQEIAGNKRYDFVFDKSADVVMLYSAKKYDISDLVLRKINVTKKINTRKESAKKRFEDDEAEEANPEIEKRQKAVEEKQAQREKTLEERRQQKLDEREARKKAYEERRKKLIEEREAARKAKLDERAKKVEENQSDNKDNN